MINRPFAPAVVVASVSTLAELFIVNHEAFCTATKYGMASAERWPETNALRNRAVGMGVNATVLAEAHAKGIKMLYS